MKVLLLLIATLTFISCKQGNPEYVPVEQEIAMAHEESVERGKYLVSIMDCHACHSPKIMTPHGPEPDPSRLFAGFDSSRPLEELTPAEIEASKKWVLFNGDQTAVVGPWGTSFAGNISSSDTGIGSWSFDQFKKALTQGKYKGLDNTRTLLPPMPWPMYKNLKDEDVRAIYDYLKTTKPVDNVVPAPRIAG